MATDLTQALSQLIEKANEYHMKLCTGFIDYEKAFDSEDRSDLFLPIKEISEECVCPNPTQMLQRESTWMMRTSNPSILAEV